MSSSKWFVIVNPVSGNGKAKKQWPKIKSLLHTHSFEFDFEFTKSAKHNVSLVQKAVNQGVKQIICVGGDGTIHNTFNGIMQQKKFPSAEVILGVIPIGTGNDWIKTHGLPTSIQEAIKTIKTGNTAKQDVGRMTFPGSDKGMIYFNNMAGIGFDGYVVSKVGKYKYLGGVAYLVGALLGLIGFKNFKTKLTINDEIITTKSLMVLIGIGKYSGGGMRLTDYSGFNNGVFDVTIAKNLTKLNVLFNTPKLYNGEIVDYRKVTKMRAKEMFVQTFDINKPLIQADGELIGGYDFKVEIIPEAIQFYTI